jgi:hypothetical protein
LAATPSVLPPPPPPIESTLAETLEVIEELLPLSPAIKAAGDCVAPAPTVIVYTAPSVIG